MEYGVLPNVSLWESPGIDSRRESQNSGDTGSKRIFIIQKSMIFLGQQVWLDLYKQNEETSLCLFELYVVGFPFNPF